VEIYPTDLSLDLVEADVIKPFKTGSTDRTNSVVWDQKVLFPPHEYMFSLSQLGYMEVALPGLLSKGSERREFAPVLQINLISRPPIRMLG